MRYRQGFTLIELLVVIAIIGLLASVILVSLNGGKQKGSIAAGNVQEQNILNGIGGDALLWLDFLGCPSAPGVDQSAYNHIATFVNSPTCTTNVPSIGHINAVAFNGLNAYVSVPNASSLQYVGGNMTIAFWAYPNSTESTGGQMISKPWNGLGNYNYRVAYNSDMTVSILLSGASGVTATFSRTVPKSQWTYVVAVVSPSTMTLYLNGSLAGSQTYTAPSWTPTSGDGQLPLAIGTLYPYGGGWGGDANHAFDGNLADVRMYGRTFTSSEVLKSYLAQKQQLVASLGN